MTNLITGINVLCGDEVVKNVLVGEGNFSETLSYNLALPKGDAHDFEHEKIKFFGKTFRAVSKAVEGIEENIPLSWNKQITVSELVENADVTVFSAKDYTFHVFKGVNITCDSRFESVSKDGNRKSGELKFVIYGINNAENVQPSAGDFVVKGEVAFSFDKTSQQAISDSMKAFREKFNYAIISSVQPAPCQDRWDFTVSAK